MRILLDECVDERLRHLLDLHSCETARHAKLAGLKNGQLLTAAEAAGFDVIVTTDQEIPFQQNLQNRKIAVLILCARTNRLADLQKIVPAALRTLLSIRAGEVVKIS